MHDDDDTGERFPTSNPAAGFIRPNPPAMLPPEMQKRGLRPFIVRPTRRTRGTRRLGN